MVDVEAVVEHHLLGADHVVVVIGREVGVQAVGGFEDWPWPMSSGRMR